MILYDMNQTWKAPEGYQVRSLFVEGAFLRVEYNQTRFHEGTVTPIGYSVVNIYLNDQGREVARTEKFNRLPDAPLIDWSDSHPKHKKKLSWWDRLVDWYGNPGRV